MERTSRSWVSRFSAFAAIAIVAVSSIEDSPAREAEPLGEAAVKAALLALLDGGIDERLRALDQLDLNWRNHLTPALVEYISLAPSPELQLRGIEILTNRTGQDFGYDLNAWFAWIWQQKFEHPPYYAEFKSRLYRFIDPRFADYFSPERATAIRLDEVRWGGVRQDGIPPLRRPTMIPAQAADYLDDDNIVFGLEVNGDVRAYPKRILAWHEMFVDTVGGVAVAGVYCTLCGSMILYETEVDGVQHELGTSGFLFRSNKLMYDKDTQSLWNTLWGAPSVGPLVDQDIRLPRRSVVTTTWGDWQKRHPETTVLSLDTGHRRDYGEGVAYQDYFSTDELMFNSSLVDNRLANKAEVLGLVFADQDAAPLAISADYAMANPLIHENVGDRNIVVLTDGSGAMRVYDSARVRFSAWDGEDRLQDSAGNAWSLREDGLTNDNGKRLARLPSHSAFWFGWYGAYPKTRLIH
ncbi:MAG: DUF3179 domain-containing protein [Pseudomonadota bacterium]